MATRYRAVESRMSKPDGPLWFVLDAKGRTMAECYDEAVARLIARALSKRVSARAREFAPSMLQMVTSPWSARHTWAAVPLPGSSLGARHPSTRMPEKLSLQPVRLPPPASRRSG